MLDNRITEGYHCQDLIKITKEQWISLLKDEEIVTKKDFRLLEVMYDCYGCNVTGKQLAQNLGMPHPPLNHQVGELGKRIAKKLEIQASSLQYGGPKWWSVPFCGKKTREGYCWKLRPELHQAMRQIKEITIPEEIARENHEQFYEGAKTQIYVNSYERNRDARDKCVSHYGAKCIICGFDFEKTYGEIGRNVIHVHHLIPLHEIGAKYEVNPIEDLRPVCPNCHVIIHKSNHPYSIDKVKALIKK
jgi:5-methylcytosine-specific restriction protein A